MNIEDRQIMGQIEKDIAEIKTALLGNALSGDEGLVGKIRKIETRQDLQDNRIEALVKSKIKNDVYSGIIIFVAGLLVTGFVGLLFNYFNK